MARLRRIDLPFCLYHVLSRTNSGDIAFTSLGEMRKFLGYLAKYAEIFSFRIHAWCLMSNHFHLLLESTEQGKLSELMRRLLTAYTVYYNRRYQRHGHLFQGRFKSYVVDKTGYFLELSRYIHLNPARGEKPQDARTYAGSSFKYYISGEGPLYLYMEEIISRFTGGTEDYVSFVLEGLEDEAGKPPITRRRFIGDPDFAKRYMKRVQSYETQRLKREKLEGESKKRYRDLADAIVSDIAGDYGLSVEQIKMGIKSRGLVGKVRKLCMKEIRKKLPWTYKEIAEYFHVRCAHTVQRNIQSIHSAKE